MISKLFLVAILAIVAIANAADSSEEDWSPHHWHWHHVIPEGENEARAWSEKAQMPWEQTKKIMDLRTEMKEATTWTDKLKKMRETCEYITTTPSLDISQWTEPETWKEWKKTWIDTSMKMAHWVGKMKTAENERDKMTLLKKTCWEMLN